nr:uncharacterized mitochondrial protein AtMg00810-like [Tanacetum cinerariifolium]
MFNIDTLTMSMNYQPVFAGNQTNGNAGTKANIDAGQAEKNIVFGPQYVLLPLLTFDSQGPKSSEDEVADDVGKKSTEVPRTKNGVQDPAKEGDIYDQEKDVRDQEEAPRKQFKQESDRLFGQREAANTNSTNILHTVSSPVNVVSSSFTFVDQGRERVQRSEFESMIGQDKDVNGNRLFTSVSDVGFAYVYLGAEADFNNLELTTLGSPIPITRIHKDHPKEQIEKGIDYDEVFAPVARIEAIRSMIGSLMYLTAFRPDIMFIACACARFQVTPKVSHLHDVKRIFRYLKGQPKLGLWYPRDSPFDLEAFLDSDYVRASLDRKSTTRGCRFLVRD